MFVTYKHSSLFYLIVNDNLTSAKLFLFGEKESFLTLATWVDPIKKVCMTKWLRFVVILETL